MRLERHKNFLSLEECSILNAWVDDAVQTKKIDPGFDRGRSGYTNRYTSRACGDSFVYPQIVLDISDRIRAFCGVSSYGAIKGHGNNGVVVSCTFDGGDVYEHQDPPSGDGLATLRCNVMTRAADEGGVLFLDGNKIDLEVGELHCYLASNMPHYVDTVRGETSRVLWMFGAHVPTEDWDNHIIKVGAR